MSTTTIGDQTDGGPLQGTDQFIIERVGGATFKITADQIATFVGGSPLTTKGDLFTYDTDNARLPVGTDGQVLSANSAEATGLEWTDPSTGLTTKGDLLTRNILADIRLAVGADGQVLTADAAEATGLKWADAAGGGGLSGWNANYAYYTQGYGSPDYYYDLTAEYSDSSTFDYMYRSAGKDTTLTAFSVYCSSNDMDTSVQIFVQVNDVDTALVVTIPALFEGVVSIEANVAVSQDDFINIHLVEAGGGSTGDLEFTWTLM